MNITPQNTTIPLATAVNPHTDTLRRENNLKEVIAQPAAANQSAAEKGVASDKERARTPSQINEQVDFANLRKRAEQENSTIDENASQDDGSSNKQQNDQPKENSFEAFAEEKQLNELQQRDREVRSHELAHAAVGGASTGSPSYTFEQGSDGKKYAVGGEVSVDLSTVKGNPRATIAKMQKVHAAALAPANPSIQDTRVAATANQIILKAQSELLADTLELEGNPSNSTANYIRPNRVLEQSKQNDDSDFDAFINQTLQSQETVSPTRSTDVLERAERIETFYLKINKAYEKPPSYQFELTA
jgi:hypothetical protein